MSDAPNLVSEMFQARMKVRRLYVVGGVGILLVGAILLGVGYIAGWFQSASYAFISLLVVFIAAMAALAVVFSGLQLGDKQEAFGLPSGSIRALLSIGIMLLFVVFGLPLIVNDNRASTPPASAAITSARIPRDELDATVDRYVRLGLLPIIRGYVSDAPGAPRTTAIVELHASDHFSERLDTSKQLITAIITLLTSVVSFYFGSRSVSDAMKSAAAPDTGSTDLAVKRKELGARLETLKTGLQTRGQKVDKTATLPDPAKPDEIALRKKSGDAVGARRTALEAQRANIEDVLATVDQALASLASAAPPDAKAVQEKSVQDGIAKASDLLAATEGALPAYDSEIDQFVAASAQG